MALFKFEADEIVRLVTSKNMRDTVNALMEESIWKRFRKHLRISKMEPLECVCYMVNSRSSYTHYSDSRKCLRDFGYDALRDDSDLTSIRTLLSNVIIQRFKMRVHPKQRAVSIFFEALFAQLNYWIVEGDFYIAKDHEYVKNPKLVLQAELVWRTDATPSSNKKKPFLVFGISVIYKGCEVAFTDEKIRFFPCVIQFTSEENQFFEFWGDKAKEAFHRVKFDDNRVAFGIDGGGFFKWVGNMTTVPYCSCEKSGWGKCCCDLFKIVGESFRNVFPWKELKGARPHLEFNPEPLFSELSDEHLELFKDFPISFYEKQPLKEAFAKECEDKEVLLAKFLSLDFTNTKCISLKDLTYLWKSLALPLPKEKNAKGNLTKDILLKASIEIQKDFHNGESPQISIDKYWYSRFVLCIMHGSFNLVRHKIMFLYQQCKHSSFYFPRFVLAMKAYAIHFGINVANDGSEKVTPMCGHDCDRFDKEFYKIIDAAVIPQELVGVEMTLDVLKKVVKDLTTKHNIEIPILETDTEYDLVEKVHNNIGENTRAIRIKKLFRSSIEYYATLKNGISKFTIAVVVVEILIIVLFSS